MDSALSIAIAVFAVIIFASILMMVSGKKSSSNKSSKQKNRSAIVKDATKKLSHNPNNIEALSSLAQLYYSEHTFDKALPLYETLVSLSAKNPELDQGELNTRRGICFFKLNKFPEAANSLILALKSIPANYEANLYLGKTLYKVNDQEKAIPLLKKALSLNPEATGIYEPLGFACYKAHRFKEAIQYLKKALDETPENKEILYVFADALQECSMSDKALKIFSHLRADPKFGAQASLASGIIHIKMQQLDKAALDFEIGLKHQDIPQETLLELNYRLASCYFRINKIANGLECLNKIQYITPSYKDVNSLVSRYKELNQNSNLQMYLTSGTSDFVALCRNFVKHFHRNSFVKIIDVAVISDSIEILCEVENSKWEDKELFRFYRNSGAIGELFIRDFHAKIRDSKCDKGFCITSGSFSEEAHKYIDGRPIDLIEKNQLLKILKMIS